MHKIQIEDYIKYKDKIECIDFIIYKDTEITRNIDTGMECADKGLKFKRIVTNRKNSFIHFYDEDDKLVLEIG